MNTFDRRLRAFSIDTSFAFFLVLCLIPIPLDADIKKYLVGVIYFGVSLVPYLFGSGQTFGKRIQKIKVIKNTSELVPTKYVVPNRFYLILREFTKCCFIIMTFGLYILVAGIVSTNREDGRTIHDFIFKTRVIVLTRYSTDRTEMNRTSSAEKSLKGYSYDD
ncbi:MAG: RDD family protein [Bacilli bacterium]|nr:RDD family protein [Bacilli bacterium]